MKKEYEGTVYLGVVGPDSEDGPCRDSIDGIQMRMGDIGIKTCRATKGYEARQYHVDFFRNKTTCQFILLLDHDMEFPRECLEQLRSHKLPFVSGYYLRRRTNPIAPVWFYPPNSGQITLQPWVAIPEKGKLYELGASGWGCILIHRDVFDAVDKLLKGEQAVLEDDMDVWPYDLGVMMDCIKGIKRLAWKENLTMDDRRELARKASALEGEFRPLRGVHDVVGSDIRFPFYARAAGYKLYGDPNVRCGHNLNYKLHPDDYDKGMTAELVSNLLNTTWGELRKEEERIGEALKRL